MRRTERSTQTANVSNRSRTVETCAVAQAVPWAWCRNACRSTEAAAVNRTRH